MAMYELDGNHLLPVRLGRSADSITLSHSLVAIQRQIVDVLRRPLFPLSWDEIDGGASLTALDATGQVVVVEVLERVDSAGLLAAMSRLTQAAAAGRREIASRYAGGLGAFSEDWNEFREAMPAQVEPGPRLTILSAALEPDVVGGLGVLASSGLEIHEVDVRIVDESRIVVVVEKISGMDVASGGPLLVARAPRPALAGSAGAAGADGSRAVDASEQVEQTSPVTGPIEIVLPPEPVGDLDADPGADGGGAIPAGAFAASGAADALSELFEPVAVTAEQPQVHALAAQGRAEARNEDRARESAEDIADDNAHGASGDSSDNASGADGPDTAGDPPESHTDASAGAAADDPDIVGGAEPQPRTGASDFENGHGGADRDGDDEDTSGGKDDGERPGAYGTDSGADKTAGVGVGRDLADILSGDSLTGPITIDLGDGLETDDDRADDADPADDADDADPADDAGAQARAVAALAGGVDILGGSSLSGGGGSAASAGSALSDAPLGAAADSTSVAITGGTLSTAASHTAAGDFEASGAWRKDDSRSRMGRRSRATRPPSQNDAPSSPTSHAATTPAAVSGASDTGEHSAQAAEAWSTVAPNEARPAEPTGAVPLVSWEPLRGSADALDPVAEALGGDPSKSLVVQETAELAAVAATLGEPTQLIWQRLRRGIYHEAMLSVEGVITLSDGRSFTDPTSAANAAQAVTDADGWRVWRVGVHGPHLGDLRDDLADRSF